MPGDPDSLQVHLSLDEPAGSDVAYLRDYYCDNPTFVRDPIGCIDLCNHYLEFSVGGCWVCGAQVLQSNERSCADHASATGPA